MQLVECATQIRDMAAEKELKDKDLKELKGAAQSGHRHGGSSRRGSNQ
jgi:hypothetical protein